jgi:hypothetical protein
MAVSTEADIELAEHMMAGIETYLSSGVAQPEKNLQLAAEMEAAGNILDGIEMLHTFKIDRLANYQIAKVADLRRRWDEAKDKMGRRPRM